MDVLYLAHCVPNPPDKGERIRAFHEVKVLAEKFRVHVACFARSRAEKEAADALTGSCASVHAEVLPAKLALTVAAARFAAGACLTTAFYHRGTMRRYVESLARQTPLAATVAYSSAMAQYAPQDIPLVLDLVDVDSEKWLLYGKRRFPRFAWRMEGVRLRRLETHFAERAHGTFVASQSELRLLRGFLPNVHAACVENGVDFDYFDPAKTLDAPGLKGRKFIVFVGVMSYFPNSDAFCWFADEVFPQIRQLDPYWELIAVGRDPSAAVSRRAARPGVTVTGTVNDVRPYLAAADVVIAPLRIARGVQNKVLEALAMGKRVFASPDVCDTLGPQLPAGIVCCASPHDFVGGITAYQPPPQRWDPAIREDARRRFSWNLNLEPLIAELRNAGLHASLIRPSG